LRYAPNLHIIAHRLPPRRERPARYPDRVKKAQEIEIKIAVAEAPTARASLRGKGFRIHKSRVFEQNLVLDDEHGSVKARNLLLRLRTAGKVITCTFKGEEIPGRHKRREEREFHPDDLDECLAVFRGIGFTPVYTYEKYRTEFQRLQNDGKPDPGVVTLDETPIGVFLELEGPARWIDRTAKELGYGRNDYITASYSALYAEWCREYGIESKDMRFSR
jgi:adenylate cyclase, class 2